MNNKLLVASLAASALLSQAAAAEGFVGIAGGASEFSRDLCTNASSCDRRGNAWSVRGGWMFLPWLGVEARYNDFGRATATVTGASLGAGTQVVPFAIDTHVDLRSTGVGGVLAWPVGGGLSINGVAGVARVKVEVDTPDVTIQTSGGSVTSVGMRNSATRSKPYYGVGVDYRFARDFSVGIDLLRQRVDGGGDIDMLTAGVTYRFR